MKDYKKAANAAKLLKESGVNYVLSYDNGENCTAITSIYGDWQSRSASQMLWSES